MKGNNFVIFIVFVLAGLLVIGIFIDAREDNKYTNQLQSFLANPLSYVNSQDSTEDEEEQSQIDNRPLEIEVVSPVREVLNPYTEITVVSNKKLMPFTANDIEFGFAGEDDSGTQYYLIKVSDISRQGKEIALELSDEAGNSEEVNLAISRGNYSPPAGYDYISGWPESSYILDGNDLDVQVTKSSRLFEDYVPENIVDLNSEFGILTLNNASIRVDAARALDNMLRALRTETGVTDVTVVSGFRSYETQVETYSYWLRTVGEARANEISARPGHSEHQLGTTVDLSTVSLGYELNEEFGSTVAGEWLAANAQEYGFRQFNDSDYDSEPWQFRYYGVSN